MPKVREALSREGMPKLLLQAAARSASCKSDWGDGIKIKLKPGQVDEIAEAEAELKKSVTGESEEVITEYEFDWGAQFLEVRSNQVKDIRVRVCGPKAIALMAFMRRRRGITSDQDLIRLALCELAIHTLKRRGADSKLVRMAD